MDAVKEDMQSVGLTEEDAGDGWDGGRSSAKATSKGSVMMVV